MRITLLSIGLAMATVVVTLAIIDQAVAAKVDEKPTKKLISLADSLKPLKDHFNANKHRVRFVTLLSPT